MRPARSLAALAALVGLAVALAAPVAAGATTLLSISGTGDLRLTTTGSLSFVAAGLDLTRADLYADGTLVIDPTITLAPPASPDVQLVYSGISGTTVLDLDDDVTIVDFTFAGTIDFRAADMLVAGGFGSVDTLTLGAAAGPIGTGCDPTGGGIVTTTGGSTLPVDQCGVDVIVGPDVPIVVAAAVPEPGAALLFCTGLLLAGARLRGEG